MTDDGRGAVTDPTSMAVNALTGEDGSGGDERHVWTGDELKDWAGWTAGAPGTGGAAEPDDVDRGDRPALIGEDGMAPDSLVYMIQAQLGMQATYSTLVDRFGREHPGKVVVEGIDPEHPGLDSDDGDEAPLEHPDVEVTVADAETAVSCMGALADRLRDGHKVIVFVDSDELQAADPDERTAHQKPNHYLVVTGLDETAGWVIMNDPLNHTPSAMPLAQFEDAWKDSNYGMVDVWAGAAAGSGADPPAGSLIPVTLQLTASAPMSVVGGVAGPVTGPAVTP